MEIVFLRNFLNRANFSTLSKANFAKYEALVKMHKCEFWGIGNKAKQYLNYDIYAVLYRISHLCYIYEFTVKK